MKKTNIFDKIKSICITEKLKCIYDQIENKENNQQNIIDCLFDLIIINQYNYKYFENEICKINEILKSILFNPPYSIIFGRIHCHEQYRYVSTEMPKNNQALNECRNIQLFDEGFDISNIK